MSDLGAIFHVKKNGTQYNAHAYTTLDECPYPNLKIKTKSGTQGYVKLTTNGQGDVPLRVKPKSESVTYQVLSEAAINDLFTQIVQRTVTEVVDDGVTPLITSIGDYVFQYCSALTTINLPAATSIGREAFYGCNNLNTVNLPKVTSIIEAYMFGNCYSLTTAKLSSAISVETNAFYYCISLTSVDLSKATSIEDKAFYECYNLTTVSLPAATSIGSNAFNSCSALTSIHFAAANKSKITALSGYSSKFGATKATIYFDL